MPNTKPTTQPGSQYHYWTIIRLSHTTPSRKRYWLCRCRCGQERLVEGGSLRKGISTSCGKCGTKNNNHRTHGMSNSPEYIAWFAMTQRVGNPKNKEFHNYGARGITICERWRQFENFLADMGRKPSPAHSVERLDNNREYSPNNCKWATIKEQQRNKRTNRVITWRGRTQCITDWSIEMGGGSHGLSSRLCKGWSVERALSTPFIRKAIWAKVP